MHNRAASAFMIASAEAWAAAPDARMSWGCSAAPDAKRRVSSQSREVKTVKPTIKTAMMTPEFPSTKGPMQPNFASTSAANWHSAPPVIQDGKVVFTAPDANSVHCINLRDGTPVWKKRQSENDLYLAGVFGGKVLIVAAPVRQVSLYSASIRGIQVLQSPTILVIDRRHRARTLVGYTDSAEIGQAVDDALAGR